MTPNELVELWQDIADRSTAPYEMLTDTMIRVRLVPPKNICPHPGWQICDAADPTWVEFVHGEPEGEARIRFPATIRDDGLFTYFDDGLQQRIDWIKKVHAYEEANAA